MPPAVASVSSIWQWATSPTKKSSCSEAGVERREPQEQLAVGGLARERVADGGREEALAVEEAAPVVVGVAGVARAVAGFGCELADLLEGEGAELVAVDGEVAPPGDARVVAAAVARAPCPRR